MANCVKNLFTAVATTLLEIFNISLTTDDDPRLTPIPKHTRVVHGNDENVADLGPATAIYSNGTAPYDIVRFFTHRKNADGKVEYCALPPPSWEVSASLTKPVRDSLTMLKKGKAKNLVKSIEQLKVTANWNLCKHVVDGDEDADFVPRYAIDKGVDSDGKLWLLTIWNPIWFSEEFARENYGAQLDEYLAEIELLEDQPQQPEPSKAPKRKSTSKTPSIPKRQSRRGKVDQVSTETAKSTPESGQFEDSTSESPKRPHISNGDSGLKEDDQMDVQSESAIDRPVVDVIDQPEIEATAQVESVVETAPLTSNDAASIEEPVPVLQSSKQKLLKKLASKLSCHPSDNLDLNNDDQDGQAGDSLVVTSQPVASVEEERGLAEANNAKVVEPVAKVVSVASPVPDLQNACPKNTLASVTSAQKLPAISSSKSKTSIDSGNSQPNSSKVCVVPPATAAAFKAPISASVPKRKLPTKGIVSKVSTNKTTRPLEKYQRSVPKSIKPKTAQPKTNSIPVHKMLENWNAEQRKRNERREERLEDRNDDPQPSVSSSSSSVTSSASSSTTRPSSASKRPHDSEPSASSSTTRPSSASKRPHDSKLSADVAAFKRHRPNDTQNLTPQAGWTRSTEPMNRALLTNSLNMQVLSDMNLYRKSMELYQRDLQMYNAALRQANLGGINPVFIEPSKTPAFPEFFGQRVPFFGTNVVTDQQPDTSRPDTPRPNLTLPSNERYIPGDNGYLQPSSLQSYRSDSDRNESRERTSGYDRRSYSQRSSQSAHERSHRRSDEYGKTDRVEHRGSSSGSKADHSRGNDRRSQSQDRSRRNDRRSQSRDRSRRDDRQSQSRDRSRRNDRRSQSRDRSRKNDRQSQSRDRSRKNDRQSSSNDRVTNHRRRESSNSHRHDYSKHHRSK